VATVDGKAIKSGDKVQKGKNVAFTATPDAGYSVKEWRVNGKPVAGNTSYTLLNLQGAAKVTVEFKKDPVPVQTFNVKFGVAGKNGTLGATVNGSTITSVAKVEQGKNIVFTAAPKDGYSVEEWKVNGKVVRGNTSNVYALTDLQGNVNVTVEFKKNPKKVPSYAVTFGVDKARKTGGDLKARVDDKRIKSGESVLRGKDVKFIADPKAGYRVKAWKVNGKVVPGYTKDTFTLTNLKAATNVTVEYELKPHAILKKHGGHPKDKKPAVQPIVVVERVVVPLVPVAGI
jgi:hypothetical protein